MGKWFHSFTFHLSALAIALSCCSLTMAQSDTKASAKEGKVDKMPLKAGPEDKLEKVAQVKWTRTLPPSLRPLHRVKVSDPKKVGREEARSQRFRDRALQRMAR